MSAATATFTFDPLAPLLPLLAAGDREAMPQIAKRFTPLIRRIAQRRGAGGGQDDVVQETLLRLWRSAGRFDPERGTEQAFVATVASNTATDLVRRTMCRPSDATADIEAVAPPTAAVADRVADAMSVRAALAQLSPAQRELLRLAYFEHLTQVEVAERLGIPIGTVKSRTFQALRNLRAVLEPDGASRRPAMPDVAA
jgi:RNA polymerase sigma-70 factor (ECF subfamily)